MFKFKYALAMSVMAVISIVSFRISATERFISFSKGDDYKVSLTGTNDTVTYDPADWEGVRIAVENLRKDLTAVTGSPCAPVIVGTAGKSSVISKYADVLRELDGKWEQYVITTDGDSLVIIGSDKRGTIYGIYELSRQLGVSPWYWWADVPVARHDEVYVRPGRYTDGEPTVKYRGIFINDEWPRSADGRQTVSAG